MQVDRKVDAALDAEEQDQTCRRETAERIGIARGKREPAKDDKRENRDQQHARYYAELLAGDGENEVRVAVGKNPLQGSFSGTLAEPAAAYETFKRGIHLKGIADAAAGRRRIDKAQDACAHMRHEFEGQRHRE